MTSRRCLLQNLIALGVPSLARAAESGLPPVRAITKGPRHHWFGYYDKLQFDPSSHYALGMQVDFEHRSPRPDDVIRLGVIDTEGGDKWTEIGTSRAWNWQQGCMLQWLPGSKDEVIWNDRQDGQFVSVRCNVKTGRKRILSAPVYAISPNASFAVYPDFRRLNDCRPGYGYCGLPDPNADKLTPDDAGIWRVDLKTGKSRLLLSLADASKIPDPHNDTTGAKHWFNHLLYSPDGSRFIFLHRWRGKKEGNGFSTRMFTIDAKGGVPYVLDPYGKTSHFIWRDPAHVLAWAWHPSKGDKFYLFDDKTQHVEAIGENVMTVNGHCTYLPGNKWILNDTYPDKQRNQNPYLYEVATGRRVPLGHFRSAPEYTGEWRCDNHPRFSPDGRKVIIDSPHAGDGRQMYLIDIGDIAKERS